MRKIHLSVAAVSASLNAGNDIATITKKTVIPTENNFFVMYIFQKSFKVFFLPVKT